MAEDSAFPPVPAHQMAAAVAAGRAAGEDDPRSFLFQMMALEGAAAGDPEPYVPRGDTLEKNRYLDMLPSREHRVRLRRDGSDEARRRLAAPDGDYINACHLRGVPGARHEYIAAQAPVPAMFGDWWLMVWEQEVRVVLMLTRLIERGTLKANQYWPQLRKTEIYGDFEVTLTDRRAFANETVRTMELRRRGSDEAPRRITHVQYTTWPDHGVPDNPEDAVRFLELYRVSRAREAGKPILLHCSAGVGRTGTFCAIDVALDTLEADSAAGVSVFEIVRAIRRCRPGAVQTPAQYAFVFEVLAYAAQNSRLGLGYR